MTVWGMMMKHKKLCVDDSVLENFSVALLKDFEGCVPAVKYFNAIYGDQVKNIRALRKQLVKAIQLGKSDWIINFCLNMLKPKYRMEFYGKYLLKALKSVEDESIQKDIELAFNYYCKNNNEKTVLKILANIESHLIPIKSELHYYNDPSTLPASEEVINTLQYEKNILESIRFFIEDKDKKFTRTVTDGLMKLAESKCYLNFVEYKYEETIQEIALDLMDHTEIWGMKDGKVQQG